jgi:hypothetical protein
MTARNPDRVIDVIEVILVVVVVIFAGALALQFLGWL